MTDFLHLHPTVRKYVNNSELASSYDSYFSNNNLFFYDCHYISQQLSLPCQSSFLKVLDLGCGTGRHVEFLYNNNCLVTGVDLNPYMLKVARSKLQSTGIPFSTHLADNTVVRLLQSDFHNLPFDSSDHFDAVIMMFSTFGLIDSSSKRLDFLIKLKSFLNPNCKAIFHVHNYYHTRNHQGSFKTFMKQLFTPQEPGDFILPNYRGVLDLYIHSFRQDELYDLFSCANYSIIDFLPLNETRTGILSSPDSSFLANGFLFTAVSH